MMNSIIEVRFGLNAKPPINHTAKYAEAKRVSAEVAEFLASGREIEQLASVGLVGVSKTYKEVNDSTYVAVAK
tara:strand:- start:896 stop:1114 length:219 start_codon:yes stop_codon:yes gene_type:complete